MEDLVGSQTVKDLVENQTSLIATRCESNEVLRVEVLKVKVQMGQLGVEHQTKVKVLEVSDKGK